MTYLNGEDVLLPNSLVVALSSNVTFRAEGPGDDPTSVVGLLTIPFPREGEEKPGWIVDGQQRAMALMQSKRVGLAGAGERLHRGRRFAASETNFSA